MSCAETLELLFEIDLATVNDDPESPLAVHLGGCDGCREVLGVLRESEAALVSLVAAGPREAADALADRVVAQTSEGAGASSGRRNRILAALLPLAAAAIGFALLWPRATIEVQQTVVPTSIGGAPMVEVAVPAGHNAAIFGTANPRITVVWLYEGDRS